jgi:DNA polymerase
VTIHLDTETFSETPIKHGTYRYCEDAEIMVVTYALNDEPVLAWDLTLDPEMPDDLRFMLEELDDEIEVHNEMFDRTVTRISKNLKLNIPIGRWRCSMVRAMAHSLPGGLEKLCDIYQLGEDEAKIKDGKQLIQLFCKPRPKNSGLRRATRLTHPEEWKRFIEYAISDVTAMRALGKKIPVWNYRGAELEYHFLDQKINDRGFMADRLLAEKAIEAVAVAQAKLKKETQEKTSYDAETGAGVESMGKRDQLLCYLVESYGVDLPDLQKDTLERRINDPELPDAVKELLRMRLQTATTSTSKYNALLKGLSSDGRMKGTIQFNGAGRTGRAAGRTFQPQNLPRPDMEEEDIEFAIEVLKLGAADLYYDNVMKVTSNTIRGCIIAPEGKLLAVADLANIEGRGLAWEAQEEWAIQSYRDYDTILEDGSRKGPDSYLLAYSRAFGIPYDQVTKEQRKIGKVLELFMGYQGGVGAFITGAETYHIDLDAMADAAYESIPDDVWGESKSYLGWATKKGMPTFGLSEKTFCTCDSLKRMWRTSRPKTEALWADIENTVRVAIRKPATTFVCGRVKIRFENAWLRIQLPSGRALCYPSARVEEGDKGQISYMGMNQYSRKWCRLKTYGGKLVENITQAIARDLLYHGMKLAEDSGYEVVLSVHDELITEIPEGGELSWQGLAACMSKNPPWAEGLPLAAAGFEGRRYRKD